MSTQVKTKTSVKTAPQIRIVRNQELDIVLGNMRFYFPIMDDNEIIKMLISKGNILVENEMKVSNFSKPAGGLMTQVLNARKNNNMFITNLTEEVQDEINEEQDLDHLNR
jgi:hypothetical protein